MATIKSYTDLEQSKKLAKILPLSSADVIWDLTNPDLPTIRAIPYEDSDYNNKYLNIIAAWSLSALLHLLPSEFTEKGKYSETTYEIDIRKYALTEDVDLYQIAYGNYKFYEDGNSSWKDMINTGEKENLIDAAFDMICWLKENEKI